MEKQLDTFRYNQNIYSCYLVLSKVVVVISQIKVV